MSVVPETDMPESLRWWHSTEPHEGDALNVTWFDNGSVALFVRYAEGAPVPPRCVVLTRERVAALAALLAEHARLTPAELRQRIRDGLAERGKP